MKETQLRHFLLLFKQYSRHWCRFSPNSFDGISMRKFLQRTILNLVSMEMNGPAVQARHRRYNRVGGGRPARSIQAACTDRACGLSDNNKMIPHPAGPAEADMPQQMPLRTLLAEISALTLHVQQLSRMAGEASALIENSQMPAPIDPEAAPGRDERISARSGWSWKRPSCASSTRPSVRAPIPWNAR
jgi:hypothetical protein